MAEPGDRPSRTIRPPTVAERRFAEHAVDMQALNLAAPPIAILIEGCEEEGGAYADKALGAWPVADIPRPD